MYAKTLMKTEMFWEFTNNSDVDGIQMPRTKEEVDAIASIDGYLAKVSKPLDEILGDGGSTLSLGDNISTTQAKKILIVTTWRSGSSFLGDLLNHYPGTWYSFEPLLYPYKTLKDPELSYLDNFYVRLVSDIFKCHPEHGYYQYVSSRDNHTNLFKHNFRFWKVCKKLVGASGCFMPELTEESCPIFPIRVMKVVRMRMRLARRLFDDPEVKHGLKIGKTKLNKRKVQKLKGQK